jgi:membrane protease YdiL (CAAX protease family)
MRGSSVQRSKLADAVIVVIICFGWFMLGSVGAVASGFPTRSFDDSTFVAIIVYEVIFGTIALLYLRFRGHDLSPLVPRPTAVGCLVGFVLYIVVVLLTWPIYSLTGKADLASQPIEQMVAGASISLPWLLGVSVVNGLYEETFLVGFLLREMETFGASFAIGVTVLVRVLYHLYQGPIGMISVIIFGVVIAIYYWRTRQLWPVVFAHIFTDLAGFALSRA